MPHSAAFNARRRELYRQARIAGVVPREAGHIYTDAELAPKVAAALSRPVARPVRRVQSPLARQVESGIRPGRYHFHSYYPTYVKVRIDTVDDNGRRRRGYSTVVFDELRVPTQAEVMERVHEQTERNQGRYPLEIVGVSVISIEQVPDREVA